MSSAAQSPGKPVIASWPSGGGKMGQRMREFDWSQHPLGQPEGWPQSLRTSISIMLCSRYAMWLGWGPEFWFFCNDAYVPTLGLKESWALGASARKVWAEIWPDVGARAESVVRTGNATWDEGLLLFLERSGSPEETYHTFSYSPVPDDKGGVGGMLCVVTEVTARVIGERRLALLRDLAGRLTGVTNEGEVFAAVRHCLQASPKDLPIALVYLFEGPEKRARLACASGVVEGAAIAPVLIALDDEKAVWPVRRILEQRHVLAVEDLQGEFGELPSGPWDIPPKRAVIVRLFQNGVEEPAGFLVVGANPYRPFDFACQGFIDLVAGQIAAALSGVRAYEQERQRAEAAAEISRAKTAFFSKVSHEFRTPLTLMLGPLEDILHQSGKEGLEDKRALAEVAHRNGLRLLRLVNTLLDFSRIESGHMEAAFEPLDLAAVTAEVAEGFRSAIERSGLQFTIDCPPLKEAIYADHDLWEKIVLNLLSNAFKFTLKGQITVRLRDAGEFVELTVQDTGAGIAKEAQEQLFERFYRVRDVQSRSYEGSGIGLALVSELAKLHGGRVEVASREGEGSAFKVYVRRGKGHLPAENLRQGWHSKTKKLAASFIAEVEVWQQDLPKLEDRGAPKAETGRARPRVLVADDNADMREYVARLLSPHFEVQGVGDGRAALAAIQTDAPDLVLSDVMMPEMDGMDLLKAIRSRPELRSIPVILFSARGGEEARGTGLDAGADDYLTKPFSDRELVARVTTHLALARLRRDAARRVTRAEDQVQHLLALLPAAVYACDAEGRITFFNQRAVELWGRAPLLNEDCEKFCACYKMFRPDGTFVAPDQTPMAVAIREGRSFRNVEAEVERPDGTRFTASISIDPLRDEAGKIIGAINVFQDITARKRTEAELLSREQLYRSIGESINYGIWVCDADGRNLYTSDSFLKLAGLTQEEASGFGWASVLHPDDAEATMAAWKECARSGAFWEREHRVKGVDGQWHPVLARGMPVRDEHGTIVRWAGLNLDIATFKKTEEALRQQSEILAVLNRVSSILVAERNLEKIVQSVTDASREVSGAAFGAFFYNVKNERGESFTLHTLSGVPKEDFAKFVEPNKKQVFGDDFRKERLMRIGDATKDAIGDEAPYSLMTAGGLEVRSYMAVPVISNSGEVLGGMFFSHPEPNVFTEASEGILLALAAQAAIAIDNASLYNSLHRELDQVKRVEGALRASETRWRELAEAMPHLVWTCGPDGSYDFVSPQWCDYTGRTEAEQLGFGWVESIHPDDREHMEAAWNKAAHSRGVLDMEMRIRRADGKYRWFKIRAVPAKDKANNILKWYGSNTDIEDLKRTDLALREREAHLSAIFAQAGSGIIQTDLDGRILMVNDAYCDIVGRTREELLGMRIHDITHPEDLPLTLAPFEDMMRGGPAFIIEKRDVRADGSSVWVRNSVVGIRDSQGRVTAGLTITQDITDSREAEDALRASEEQLRLVTDHAPVLLAQFDRDHRYKFVNQPYAERFGYKPKEVIGKHVWEIIGANAYADALDKIKTAFTGKRVEFEVEIPYEALGMRWGHVIYVPELTPEGEIVGVVSVLTDITMRKQGEKELEQARDRALAAVRAKDDFLARLSHELRTPLSPVLLLASEGANNHNIPDAVRADFEIIRKNVDLEARLIDDLLDLTRITRGKLKLDLRTVDIHAVLKDALATMRSEVTHKNIHLILSLGVPKHWVMGDAVRLQQVFWNLLNNAVKFTPSSGSIQIETKLVKEDTAIVIEVSDTGIGMTSDELRRIFDAFSQGDHANDGGSMRFGGLGLGLAITRMLVDLHQGQIRAASAGRGRGATFSIELPLVEEGRKDAGPPGKAVHPPASARRDKGTGPLTSSLRILLVEDHEPTRTALSSLLGRRKHQVTAAGSLAEARELFAPGKFDLIISDIGLPDGNGYELMSEWREVPGLKGIALSGYGMEHDVSRSWEAGFSSHLTKPVKMETLDKAIAEAMAK